MCRVLGPLPALEIGDIAPTVYLIHSLLGFAPHVPLPFLSAGPFSLLKVVPYPQPQPLCPSLYLQLEESLGS